MKIIAKDDRDRYIVTVHKDELANLCGYCSDYQSPIRFAIGAEIQVHSMYQQLYSLANKKGQLAVLARELRTYADLLEMKPPILEPEGKSE